MWGGEDLPPTLSDGKGAVAFFLNLAGTDDTLTDDSRRFARLHLRELGKGHSLYLAMDVDTVEEFIYPYRSKSRLCKK